MGAEHDFPEDNWVRDTGKKTRAGVIGYCLQDQMPEAIAEICGRRPALTVLSEQGWSNFSFLVEPGGEKKWLLRLQSQPKNSAEELWSPYHKEAWCMEAAKLRLPVPALPQKAIGYFRLEHPHHGRPLDLAYLLQEYIEGKPARACIPSRGTAKFLRSLGSIARAIHEIPAQGKGSEFCPRGGHFKAPCLKTFFEQELQKLAPALSYLAESGAADVQALAGRVSSLGELPDESRLAHRDFLYNWGNVLVDGAGAVACVIDWELAFAGPAMYLEFGAMHYAMMRDGLDEAERERRLYWFLDGYGLSRRLYRKEHAQIVKDFTIWYSLKAVQKYLNFSESGEIKIEPWRRLFAERSVRFIQGALAERHAQVVKLPRLTRRRAA